MIRLVSASKPVELTDHVCKELTELFKTQKKSVWQQKYIEDALLAMSHHKCCYCECKLDKESNYMEVEHFRPKGLYPDLVVEWSNLLPSCKRCNGNKHEHDTGTEPIIHPLRDTPNEHLTLKNYRLFPKNKSLLGRCTIDITYLNDPLRLVPERCRIGTDIQDKLEELLANSQAYANGSKSHSKQRTKIINTLRNLMLEGTAIYEYSATAATILLTDEHYPEIKSLFQLCELWNDEFSELEKELKYHSLA